MNDILLDIASRIKRVFKIDGETYKAKRVKITESKVGNVIVDGVCYTQTLGQNFTVEVDGDVDSISTGAGSVNCHKAGSVNTMSGGVTCGDVDGDVETMSGSVKCGKIKGDVETMSGSVRQR
jgi:hypothetical protein